MTSELGSLAVLVGVACVSAFALAWFAETDSAAYIRGIAAGFLVLFGRSCVDMFSADPVQANEAAEGFFWSLPFVFGWLVLGVIAVASARELRRARTARGQNEKK